MNSRPLNYWLYYYRGWGIFPLLVCGLGLSLHQIPAKTGYIMMLGGAIGILFGTLLRIACVTFVGAESKLQDTTTYGKFVTDGPYAITRNPMYLADAGIALGVAMMSRMPWLVLATLILGGIYTALIIDWEEKSLRNAFGQAYMEYCKTVPRWFSIRRLIHPDSYFKTRGSVKLLSAVSSESSTLLVGLIAILGFIIKAYLDYFSK